jgi:dipeptidyl aminopeptidase/acylaminoacyl peptidase
VPRYSPHGSASSPTATPTAASPAPTSPGRHEVVIGGGDVAVGGILFRPQAAEGRSAIIVLHGWHDDCGLRQPDDVVRAAAWLREQSGVSGDRLAVVGFSQGGQVALLAATRDTRLRAVVAYYPVTDVPRWKTTTTNLDIPGYISAVCWPGGIMARSPLLRADTIGAPVLLVHGDADTRVPTAQSQMMRAALEGAGRSVQLFLVPGAQHGFTAAEDAVARPVVDAFLAAHLR